MQTGNALKRGFSHFCASCGRQLGSLLLLFKRAVILTLITLLVGLASSARAECFDAKVHARILAQAPSTFPDCGPDCIVMEWPWFVKLRVKELLEGELEPRKIIVLSVQHDSYVRKEFVWLLRRNTAGGFNATQDDGAVLQKCDASAGPVNSFLTLGPGQTWETAMQVALKKGFHTNTE